MKKTLLFLLSSLLLISANSTFAEQVTINVDSTVSYMYDPYGVVSDITLGQSITGSYTYETTTLDSDPALSVGYYPHAENSGRMELTAGNYTFKTNAFAYMPIDIFIDDEEWLAGQEAYFVNSIDNEMTNGATIDALSINMVNQSSSNALTSSLLTATAPDLNLFSNEKKVFISGFKDGFSFFIEADINSLVDGAPAEPPVPPAPTYGTKYMYKVTAVVTQVGPGVDAFNGKVQTGDTIIGTYIIDSTTLGTPSEWDPANSVSYAHTPGTGSISVEFNGITFSSTVDGQTPVVTVTNDDSFNMDLLLIESEQVESTDPAIEPLYVAINFSGDGAVLNSTAMPTDNNTLDMWTDKKIYMGTMFDYVTADIVSMVMLPTQVLSIVPGDSYLHPSMRFDAAFNLANAAPITGVTGTLNGLDISNYLVGCQTFAPIGSMQTVVCDDTHLQLIPGENVLNIDVTTDDGKNFNDTATWTVPVTAP